MAPSHVSTLLGVGLLLASTIPVTASPAAHWGGGYSWGGSSGSGSSGWPSYGSSSGQQEQPQQGSYTPSNYGSSSPQQEQPQQEGQYPSHNYGSSSGSGWPSFPSKPEEQQPSYSPPSQPQPQYSPPQQQHHYGGHMKSGGHYHKQQQPHYGHQQSSPQQGQSPQQYDQKESSPQPQQQQQPQQYQQSPQQQYGQQESSPQQQQPKSQPKPKKSSPKPKAPSSYGGSSGGGGGGGASGDWQKGILDATNEWRKKYGAPPVEYDQELEKFGEKMAASCKFQHTKEQGQDNPNGENLAMGTSDPKGIMDMFGSEAKDYQPGQPMSAGHFTQMVWKSTKKIGCGKKDDCPGGALVFCEYYPAGNNIDPDTCKANVNA